MKKDRNCMGAVPYPIYQQFPNMPVNQGMMTPVPMPLNQGMVQNNSIEQQLGSLNNQISNLERRVTVLENMIGNTSNKYNASNYQVM